MKVACPKCNAGLLDHKGGGTLTRCRKCGYDGSMGEEMSWVKNEWLNLEEAKQEYRRWERMKESQQYKEVRILGSKILSLEREIKVLTIKNSFLLSKH